MARGFQIFGELLVEVSGGAISSKQQLALLSDPVRVIPRYVHRDINADDFGPDIPVEVMFMMAEAFISMTLVHYDKDILDQCMRASMGGGGIDASNPTGSGAMDGFAGPAGRPLGKGAALGTSTNQFTTVYLTRTDDGAILPYRFKACYLNTQPLEIPYGSARTLVKLNWRCIPYQRLTSSEIVSTSGVALWDRTSDLLT